MLLVSTKSHKLACNHIFRRPGASFFHSVPVCLCMPVFSTCSLPNNNNREERKKKNLYPISAMIQVEIICHWESLYLLFKCYFIFSASAQASSTTSAFRVREYLFNDVPSLHRPFMIYHFPFVYFSLLSSPALSCVCVCVYVRKLHIFSSFTS